MKTRREWDEAVHSDPPGLVYRRTAPRAVALRVIARIVRELDGTEPRGGQVAKLFDSLDSGRAASIGSLVARPDGHGWRFCAAERARRS